MSEYLEPLDEESRELAEAAAKDFHWLTSREGLTPICLMETRRLVHTISMIWNHRMPEVCHTHEFKRYRFGPEYTEAYLKTAVIAMLREAYSREDRQPWMDQRLEFMRQWLLSLTWVDCEEFSRPFFDLTHWPLAYPQPTEKV
jgi:hypothetical protein